MDVTKEIFRAYDIRGIVETELTSDFAYHLGRAVGSRLIRDGGKTIVVGRDCRPSGIQLALRMRDGLTDSGCFVFDIGMVPSPSVYWAIHHLKADGGVAITGSHNPPEYNGFKLTMLGDSLHGEAIQGLHRMIETEDYIHGEGSSEPRDILPAYILEVTDNIHKPSRNLKVVVDAGNGVGGLTAVPVLENLGCKVTGIFCEPDGSFPNHHADPTVEENLEDLKKAVLEYGADIGLAFDGDADRIGVVSASGAVIWGDKLMILLSRALLKEEPGAVIIGEVKCSKLMYDDIKKNGGRPIMWKTGHSFIKAKIKEESAALAGEMSGHIFYKHRYYGFDDATYTAARLVEILGETDQGIDALLSDLPETVSTPELRMDCPESLKFDLVARLTDGYKERAKIEAFKVIDLDGARVEWEDGWGLVRCSNTQPILVLRFEAETEIRLKEIQKDMEAAVEEHRLALSEAS
ncbi:MAG: phosphomannomutase/phosphoglucomutase [Myxococcota bacterium]|nr:phosphomannomutase/phosphoglucomutase [Myxococcota bacterium]